MKPEDLQRLVTVNMPYGKYQGRLIADLPGAYLAWFARKGFPPGELGNLLALMLELDHNGLKPLLDPLRKRLSAIAFRRPFRRAIEKAAPPFADLQPSCKSVITALITIFVS